jgi:hypothetical protein
MDIWVKKGTLRCNLYNQAGNVVQTVVYDGFPKLDQWMHVTCFFNGKDVKVGQSSKNILQGGLYQNGKLNMYYYDSDNLATLQKMFYAPESLSLPTKKLTVVA